MQGKTLNGFELKRLLGVGGMAEVWYAENEIGMKAAVKILGEELSHNAQMKERFLNEAKVMVQLDHSNIRKVHGYGAIDGRPAIIMECLEGADLKKRMKEGQRFTEEELERWWNQVVDALNYTHAQHIVHRDLKPSNIFIDQKGNAKLLDFGIAKVADTTSGTLTGSTLGTRIYMSPEQVRDPKRVGTASDAYSLAVTFVHLLTGKAPYDTTTDSDYDIQECIVRKPLDLSAVPTEWRGFLAPYLEKKPENRPELCCFGPVSLPEKPETPLADVDEGTVVDEGNKKPAPKDAPKSKKGLWVALAAVIALALALILLLHQPKTESVVTDPDTEEYLACQTLPDYRAYCENYGKNAIHYAEAQHKIDSLVADSTQRAQAEALALAAEAEMEAYQLCKTAPSEENCKNYLEQYPTGLYADSVRVILKNLGISGTINGHDYVDLGLPSGTLWATCNVGANKPEDYGNYYAWGETKTKRSYTWENYKYANGSYDKLTKYCGKSDKGENGFTDNLTVLQECDDPATANWGSGWKTPSKAQWDELLSNTTHKWTKRNSKAGRLFTSKKNGQTLFLSAAGYRPSREDYSDDAGIHGGYWSRSLYTNYPSYAWYFHFDSSHYGMANDGYRWFYDSDDRGRGLSVRPVREK